MFGEITVMAAQWFLNIQCGFLHLGWLESTASFRRLLPLSLQRGLDFGTDFVLDLAEDCWV